MCEVIDGPFRFGRLNCNKSNRPLMSKIVIQRRRRVAGSLFLSPWPPIASPFSFSKPPSRVVNLNTSLDLSQFGPRGPFWTTRGPVRTRRGPRAWSPGERAGGIHSHTGRWYLFRADHVRSIARGSFFDSFGPPRQNATGSAGLELGFPLEEWQQPARLPASSCFLARCREISCSVQ